MRETAAQPASSPSVTIQCSDTLVVAEPGRLVTFGRGAECDLKVGRHPEIDDYVSRRAGVLQVLADSVLVQNDSSSQPIYLQPAKAPEWPIQPGMALSTRPHLVARVVVPGRFGWQYTIDIDLTALMPSRPASSTVHLTATTSPGVKFTRPGASKITNRERRILAALCEPLVAAESLRPRPSTYRQVASRIGSSPHAVRTCLDQLRARLSDVDGIPRLRGNEDDDFRSDTGYLAELAAWALRSGEITSDLVLDIDGQRNESVG